MKLYKVSVRGYYGGPTHLVEAGSLHVALGRALLKPGTKRSTGQKLPEIKPGEDVVVTVERVR